MHQQPPPFPSPLCPWPPFIYFPSLWICSFETVNVRGTLAFCVWLLSLSIMLARFIPCYGMNTFNFKVLKYVSVFHSFVLPNNTPLCG